MTDNDVPDYLRSRIDETAPGDDHQRLLGHFAYVTEILTTSERRQYEMDLSLKRRRQAFAVTLQNSSDKKVSEAQIDREVVTDGEYCEQLDQLHQAKVQERQYNLLREALRMRHEAFIALVNRKSSEMRIASRS